MSNLEKISYLSGPDLMPWQMGNQNSWFFFGGNEGQSRYELLRKIQDFLCDTQLQYFHLIGPYKIGKTSAIQKALYNLRYDRNVTPALFVWINRRERTDSLGDLLKEHYLTYFCSRAEDLAYRFLAKDPVKTIYWKWLGKLVGHHYRKASFSTLREELRQMAEDFQAHLQNRELRRMSHLIDEALNTVNQSQGRALKNSGFTPLSELRWELAERLDKTNAFQKMQNALSSIEKNLARSISSYIKCRFDLDDVRDAKMVLIDIEFTPTELGICHSLAASLHTEMLGFPNVKCIFESIGYCIEEQGNLKFEVQHQVAVPDYLKILYEKVLPVRKCLGALSRAEAESLIEGIGVEQAGYRASRVKCKLSTESIIEHVGYHPALLQHVCYRLTEECSWLEESECEAYNKCWTSYLEKIANHLHTLLGETEISAIRKNNLSTIAASLQAKGLLLDYK